MVESPCIGICKLEKGVCKGCFRTAKEIENWFYANDELKLEILKESKERQQRS